jgi:serine/threonine protein kinase
VTLQKEIELMQELSHPNIVRYLGSEQKTDTLHIFMEFVSGGSIQSLLRKFGAFPEKVFSKLNYITQIT